MTNGGGNTRDGKEKKNPVLYRRYLEKSLWMRAASVVCVTVLYE